MVVTISSEYIIETTDLVKHYNKGQVQAVNGLNLKIKYGEIYAFIGANGTGKTTLLTKLTSILSGKGLRVGIIKHAHHTFDIDQPGKDSYILRKAGASEMLIGSVNRWALLVADAKDQEFTRHDHIQRLDQLWYPRLLPAKHDHSEE